MTSRCGGGNQGFYNKALRNIVQKSDNEGGDQKFRDVIDGRPL